MRYYANKGDHLYRSHALKSKKTKSALYRLPRFFMKIFLVLLILCLAVFGTGYFFKTSSAFNIRSVKIIVANEKTTLDSSVLNSFIGKNLNALSGKEVEKVFDNKNSEYGVRSVQGQLPSTLKVVLYRRFPIFLVNGEWVVNNDLSVFRYTEKCVNYIPLKAEISALKSIFDIPGLPTIHKSLLRERDLIKSMAFEGPNIYIRLKNQKLVVLSAGQTLPSLKRVSESDYRVLDFRFENAIYVKK